MMGGGVGPEISPKAVEDAGTSFGMLDPCHPLSHSFRSGACYAALTADT